MKAADMQAAILAAVGLAGLERLRDAGLLVVRKADYQTLFEVAIQRTAENARLRGQLAARLVHDDYPGALPERMVELILREGPPG